MRGRRIVHGASCPLKGGGKSVEEEEENSLRGKLPPDGGRRRRRRMGMTTYRGEGLDYSLL